MLEDSDKLGSPFEGIGGDIADADACIEKMDYYGALERYRNILDRNHGNRHILQRVAELKGFLKLMGKDEGAVIARLEMFLDAIKKGRGNFLGGVAPAPGLVITEERQA